MPDSTDSTIPDASRSQHTQAIDTAGNPVIIDTRQRANITDAVALVCLTVLGIVCLVKNQEGLAMAALAGVVQVAGVHKAMQAAQRGNANAPASTPPISAALVLFGSFIFGILRMTGREA